MQAGHTAHVDIHPIRMPHRWAQSEEVLESDSQVWSGALVPVLTPPPPDLDFSSMPPPPGGGIMTPQRA